MDKCSISQGLENPQPKLSSPRQRSKAIPIKTTFSEQNVLDYFFLRIQLKYRHSILPKTFF